MTCTVRSATTGLVVTDRHLTWTGSNSDVPTVTPVNPAEGLVVAGSERTATSTCAVPAGAGP